MSARAAVRVALDGAVEDDAAPRAAATSCRNGWLNHSALSRPRAVLEPHLVEGHPPRAAQPGHRDRARHRDLHARPQVGDAARSAGGPRSASGRWKRRSSTVATPSAGQAVRPLRAHALDELDGRGEVHGQDHPQRRAGRRGGQNSRGPGPARRARGSPSTAGGTARGCRSRPGVLALRWTRRRSAPARETGTGMGPRWTLLELDGAEAVLVDEPAAQELDRHLAAQEREGAPTATGGTCPSTWSRSTLARWPRCGSRSKRTSTSLTPVGHLGRAAEVQVRVELALGDEHGLRLCGALSLLAPLSIDGELAASDSASAHDGPDAAGAWRLASAGAPPGRRTRGRPGSRHLHDFIIA